MILGVVGAIAVGIVGAVIGIISHEITHFVVALVAGRSPRAVVAVPPKIEWQLPADPTTVDQLIGIAPQVVGVILGPILLVVVLLVADPLLWIGTVAAWGFYTLNGSIEDYMVARGEFGRAGGDRY